MCQRSTVAAIVIGCLASACAPPRAEIDLVAEEYVAIARASEQRDPSLAPRIAAARQRAAEMPEENGRRAFLVAQLAALERRIRFLAGERTSIRKEAAALGITAPTFNAERAVALRADLAKTLDGSGPLIGRLAGHRRAAALPRARLDDATRGFVDTCRSRTPIPEDIIDPGVELRYVIDRPWPAFAWAADDGRSVIEIRRDVTWTEGELMAVVCHETYPGHHLQNLVWNQLRTQRRWAEFEVTPPFTPHAAMAERLAIAATRLALPAGERDPVSRILDDLAPHGLAIAIDVVDGLLPRGEGLRRLRDDAVMPDASGFLGFVEEQRSMAVAYATPPPAIPDWRSYLETLKAPARLVEGAR